MKRSVDIFVFTYSDAVVNSMVIELAAVTDDRMYE